MGKSGRKRYKKSARGRKKWRDRVLKKKLSANMRDFAGFSSQCAEAAGSGLVVRGLWLVARGLWFIG